MEVEEVGSRPKKKKPKVVAQPSILALNLMPPTMMPPMMFPGAANAFGYPGVGGMSYLQQPGLMMQQPFQQALQQQQEKGGGSTAMVLQQPQPQPRVVSYPFFTFQ